MLMQHMSYLAQNVICLRFIQCTRSVLHHRALYVCLQIPVNAILKGVIGVPDRTKADEVIAGMLPAVYDDQLAKPFPGINDKAEVACWGSAAMFGMHEYHCHPNWNINNAF